MTSEELQTRLRAFFADERAASRTSTVGNQDVAAARTFQRSLFDAGLAGLTWPVEYGGQGFGGDAEAAYMAELQHHTVATAPLTLSLKVCGPAVMQFGSPAQKAEHLIPTLRGDRIWCQLWSEPEAGSDLAGVRTRATPNAQGGWTVQGQKIWTSGAHFADFGLLLCRTDSTAAKHAGLSMMIVDMRQSGMSVRPLRQMTGDADFNEVFLDEVHLSPDALLGELGQGWPITTWMMSRERVSVGTGMRNPRTLTWSDVRLLAERVGRDSEPAVRHQLADLWLREHAAHLLAVRLAQESESGGGRPLLGSAVKVLEAAAIRESAELALEIGGSATTAWSIDEKASSAISDAVLQSPAFAIGGGTDDIQLNTLAERFLGLREPRGTAAD